jgi:hypothetical protein
MRTASSAGMRQKLAAALIYVNADQSQSGYLPSSPVRAHRLAAVYVTGYGMHTA